MLKTRTHHRKTRRSPCSLAARSRRIHAIMRVQNPVVPLERIEKAIFFLRGHKVMLSTHLAELYEVEPRALVQAVKRNIERFPPDFMFQLSKVEFENLKSQIVTSNWGGFRLGRWSRRSGNCVSVSTGSFMIFQRRSRLSMCEPFEESREEPKPRIFYEGRKRS